MFCVCGICQGIANLFYPHCLLLAPLIRLGRQQKKDRYVCIFLMLCYGLMQPETITGIYLPIFSVSFCFSCSFCIRFNFSPPFSIAFFSCRGILIAKKKNDNIQPNFSHSSSMTIMQNMCMLSFDGAIILSREIFLFAHQMIWNSIQSLRKLIVTSLLFHAGFSFLYYRTEYERANKQRNSCFLSLLLVVTHSDWSTGDALFRFYCFVRKKKQIFFLFTHRIVPMMQKNKKKIASRTQ